MKLPPANVRLKGPFADGLVAKKTLVANACQKITAKPANIGMSWVEEIHANVGWMH